MRAKPKAEPGHGEVEREAGRWIVMDVQARRLHHKTARICFPLWGMVLARRHPASGIWHPGRRRSSTRPSHDHQRRVVVRRATVAETGDIGDQPLGQIAGPLVRERLDDH